MLEPSGVANATGARKLINTGWDRPGPAFLQQNASRMQEAPFDGVTFNLWEIRRMPERYRVGNTWSLFHYEDKTNYTLADVNPADFEGIGWTTFTDNLIAVHPCPSKTRGIDFFSDEEWEAARTRIRLLGQVLRASGAMGLWFDPEGGGRGMQYSAANYPNHTFEQVAHQARIRGQQFMRALEAEKEDIKVLFTLLSSTRWGFENNPDPTSTRYGLLVHFVGGMLEAKGSRSVLIDGEENDYYRYDAQQYPRWRQFDEGAWYLFPEEAQQACAAQLHIGSSVYADAVTGGARAGGFVANHFSFYEDIRDDVEFHRMWLRHNVYHAMLKSDDYVWLWNERMSWWNPQVAPLPEGADSAIREARDLFNSGAPLGYDMCRAGSVGMPTFVESPTLTVETVEQSTTGTSAGDTLVLQCSDVVSRPGAPEWDFVRLYHNGSALEDHLHQPKRRTAVRLTPGAHTFHAVGFNTDGTHCSSAPLIIVAD